MGKALSLDLRRRVAAAVVGGDPVRVVAARFQVSATSAVRLGQKLRAGADLTPAKRGGPRRSPITAAVADWLRARLAEKPDLTMRALAAELSQHGTSVTHDTVWRFVRKQGLSVKKRP
jgi:transposase